MRPRISSNAGQILNRMMRRKTAVTRELNRAAVRIKVIFLSESRQVLNEQVYSVPIPTVPRRKRKVSDHPQFSLESRREVGHRFEERKRPKREKAWKRTGQLKAREGARTLGPVVIMFNPMAYAAARYALGTEDGRPIRTPGVKSVQWHAVVIERKRPAILQIRREALLRALTRP